MDEEEFYNKAIDYLNGHMNEEENSAFEELINNDSEKKELFDKFKSEKDILRDTIPVMDSAESDGYSNQRLKAQFLSEVINGETQQEAEPKSSNLIEIIFDWLRSGNSGYIAAGSFAVFLLIAIIVVRNDPSTPKTESYANTVEEKNQETGTSPTETLTAEKKPETPELDLDKLPYDKSIVKKLLSFAFVSVPVETMRSDSVSDSLILAPKGITRFYDPIVVLSDTGNLSKIQIFSGDSIVEEAIISDSNSIPLNDVFEPDELYSVRVLNHDGEIVKKGTFLTLSSLEAFPTNEEDRIMKALNLFEADAQGGDCYMLVSDLQTDNKIVKKLKLFGLLKAGAIKMFNQEIEKK
jgi:hypothetical protein